MRARRTSQHRVPHSQRIWEHGAYDEVSVDSKNGQRWEGGVAGEHAEAVIVVHTPAPPFANADDVRDDHAQVHAGKDQVEKGVDRAVSGPWVKKA